MSQPPGSARLGTSLRDLLPRVEWSIGRATTRQQYIFGLRSARFWQMLLALAVAAIVAIALLHAVSFGSYAVVQSYVSYTAAALMWFQLLTAIYGGSTVHSGILAVRHRTDLEPVIMAYGSPHVLLWVSLPHLLGPGQQFILTCAALQSFLSVIGGPAWSAILSMYILASSMQIVACTLELRSIGAKRDEDRQGGLLIVLFGLWFMAGTILTAYIPADWQWLRIERWAQALVAQERRIAPQSVITVCAICAVAVMASVWSAGERLNPARRGYDAETRSRLARRMMRILQARTQTAYFLYTAMGNVGLLGIASVSGAYIVFALVLGNSQSATVFLPLVALGIGNRFMERLRISGALQDIHLTTLSDAEISWMLYRAFFLRLVVYSPLYAIAMLYSIDAIPSGIAGLGNTELLRLGMVSLLVCVESVLTMNCLAVVLTRWLGQEKSSPNAQLDGCLVTALSIIAVVAYLASNEIGNHIAGTLIRIATVCFFLIVFRARLKFWRRSEYLSSLEAGKRWVEKEQAKTRRSGPK